MALPGGLHAHLQQKDIEKKVNLLRQSQDAKKKLRQSYSYIMIKVYDQAIAFELQQGSPCVFTNLPNLM